MGCLGQGAGTIHRSMNEALAVRGKERRWQLMPYGLYGLNVRLFEEPSSHVSLKLARYAEIIGQFTLGC